MHVFGRVPETKGALSPRRRAAARLLGLAVIAVVLFIWSNSLESQQDSARKSALFTAVVRPLVLALPVPAWHDEQTVHFITRKLAHFVQFFVLGALSTGFVLAVRPLRRIHALWVMLFCVFVAVADELLQFISARGPAAQDVLLDCFGAACGILCVAGAYRIMFRRRNRLDA